MNGRARFQRSPEVDALVSLLKARLADPEGIATYGDLDDCVGFNVRSRRYLLDSAREIVQREQGWFLYADTGSGIRRGDETKRTEYARHNVRRVQRAAKRVRRRTLHGIDISKMSEQDKDSLNVSLSQLNGCEAVSSDRARKRIAKLVSDAQTQLPGRKVLGLFSKGS